MFIGRAIDALRYFKVVVFKHWERFFFLYKSNEVEIKSMFVSEVRKTHKHRKKKKENSILEKLIRV